MGDRKLPVQVRMNMGKPRLTKAMLMPHAMEALVGVIEFGEQKYGPAVDRGWMNYEEGEILDSLARHLTAIINDEPIDPESQLHHAAHMLFNAAAYCEHVMASATSRRHRDD